MESRTNIRLDEKRKVRKNKLRDHLQACLEEQKNGGFLYNQLRHNGKKYHKRGKGTARRGWIPGRVDIKERPAIVEEKTRLGDWELDTIIGAIIEELLYRRLKGQQSIQNLQKQPLTEKNLLGIR